MPLVDKDLDPVRLEHDARDGRCLPSWNQRAAHHVGLDIDGSAVASIRKQDRAPLDRQIIIAICHREKRFARRQRRRPARSAAFQTSLRIRLEGEQVVTRWTGRGTNTGELLGMPPTGKEITIRGITYGRIVDGKAREAWIIWDTLAMMQQLGVIPETIPARTT
jgi:predicted ester cyclase